MRCFEVELMNNRHFLLKVQCHFTSLWVCFSGVLTRGLSTTYHASQISSLTSIATEISLNACSVDTILGAHKSILLLMINYAVR